MLNGGQLRKNLNSAVLPAVLRQRRGVVILAFMIVWLLLTFTGLRGGLRVSGQEPERRQREEIRRRVEESLRRRFERMAGDRPAGKPSSKSPTGSTLAASSGPSAMTPAEVRLGTEAQISTSLQGGPTTTSGPTSGPMSGMFRARERYDQPREALDYFLRKRLPAGEKDLSFDRYVAARSQAGKMVHYSSLLEREVTPAERVESGNLLERREQASGTWTPIGPGNIGGRTRALLVNPQNPAIMYAAGVSGGVWKSTNGGASWVPLTDLLPTITVSSMVFEPGNPQVIYVGTGEGVAAFQRDTQGDFRGAGIFKTIDGGATWSLIESTATSDFYFVNDIAISAKDKKRLYAATRTGVWRSLDGGTTWTRSLNPLNSRNQPVLGGCFDLAMRTDLETDALFAACGSFETGTVYRNPDAGRIQDAGADAGADGWSAVLSELDMGRTALAIAPSNQNIIYALASSIESGQFEFALHAVFRSTAGGESGSWSAQVRNTSDSSLNTSLLSIPTLALGNECGFGGGGDFFGQGWYDLVIAVDPLDPNRVWTGGIELFRSDDGGLNWGVAGPSYIGGNFESGPIHPDHHVIVFHPQFNGAGNQQLFVGNDGGIFRTINARGPVATTIPAVCRPDGVGVRWQSLNADYGVTQFYHGAVSPDGRSYFGGTQDNGTVIGTDQGGINQWKEILGGDGGYSAFDFSDPSTLFASYTYISLSKSTDGGQTFGSATRGIGDQGLFIAPFVVDPSDSQRLWTGGDYLWRTTNGAGSWQRASSIAPGALQVSALAVSPVDANRVLAGMADGYIMRQDAALTTSGGSNWPSTQPRQGYVSSLNFDPASPDIAFATYSTFGGNHVWRTIDGGISWTSIDGTGSGRLPDIPVHSLVIDPGNTARLYIGTDLGVFVTSNGGSSWAVEYTGFANVITEMLQLNIRDGVQTLYAFTHGRGVWRVQLERPGCLYAISPPTVNVVADQRTGTVDVTAVPGGCSWEATGASVQSGNWLTVSGRGTASGKATWSIAANTGFVDRVGTATIAGRTLTIVQPGLVDTESPVIRVTGTSVAAGTVDTSGLLDLNGSLTDNDQVVEVRWSTDRGLSGQAVVTDSGSNWRVSTIPLGTGANIVTLTAVDRAGNIGIATWRAVTNPSSILVTVAGTGINGYTGDRGAATDSQMSRPIRMAFDRAGVLYFADADNNVIRRIGADGVITTVAGTGVAGFTGDGGLATNARLDFPLGVAIDAAGNLYIVDSGNARIRKVNSQTGVITTIAGNGLTRFNGDGGPAIDATINNPQSVALDAAGNLYIADLGNNRIRKVTVADGLISTVAGTGVLGFGGEGDLATTASLNLPTEVVFDQAGNMIIADAGNNRIRMVSKADGRIQTIAGTGVRGFSGDNGPAKEATLNLPVSLALDVAGNLYFSDRGNQRIRRIAAATQIVTTIAGTSTNGFGGEALVAIASPLNSPTGLAIDTSGPTGILYFADRDNRRIRKLVNAGSDSIAPVISITTPTVLSTWKVTDGALSIAGKATDNTSVVSIRWFNDRGGMGAVNGKSDWSVTGIVLQPGLNLIRVTAWDSNGNSGSAQLGVTLEVSEVIRTLAGLGKIGNKGDGQLAIQSSLNNPSGIAVDGAGNIYVADTGNNRIRRITPGGTITAYAGSGMLGAKGDGGPALNASFNSPNALALDSKGNLFIADTYNHRIRRVSPAGIITTVAGNGREDSSGDGGPAVNASLYLPFGIAIDGEDNLLIADTGNVRIRRVDMKSGVITTIAGDGSSGSDGDGQPALSAHFKAPYGVTTDRVGNIYVVDGDDHRVRRIYLSGQTWLIAAYAGTGDRGGLGDGGLAVNAQLDYPSFISTDQSGNLYIADYGNQRIRKVSSADGRISTVVGNGQLGPGVDSVDPLTTSLNLPNDVVVDPTGRLLIADTGNHKIRRIFPNSSFQVATSTSAASYNGQIVARESLVAIFGQSLSTVTLAASSLPLPVELGGTTVLVRDAAGIERPAQLFFVSPGQINFLIPASTSIGTATVTVTSASGQLSRSLIPIGNSVPALFSASAEGRGVAAAYIIRVKSDGTQLYEPVARYDSTTARWVPVPVSLGPETDQVFLVLFGTGWRFNGPLSDVRVTAGGQPAEVIYIGPQGGFVGLDQINLRLGRSLAGRGVIDLQVLVDGLVSNLVQVQVQ